MCVSVTVRFTPVLCPSIPMSYRRQNKLSTYLLSRITLHKYEAIQQNYHKAPTRPTSIKTLQNCP